MIFNVFISYMWHKFIVEKYQVKFINMCMYFNKPSKRVILMVFFLIESQPQAFYFGQVSKESNNRLNTSQKYFFKSTIFKGKRLLFLNLIWMLLNMTVITYIDF